MATERREPIASFLPAIRPVTYQRNLIQQVVCEVKFPTVYGLERGRPPVQLANALRKRLPEHASVDNLNVGPAGVAQNFAYVFKDKKGRTSVTFRPSAMNVEISAYESFEVLLELLMLAADAARQTIDSEFFTRVGLRYINLVPYKQSEVGDWVNMELVAPLVKKSLGTPSEFSGRISTSDEHGGFLVQHGIGTNDGKSGDQYVLDFDVWREDVPYAELKPVMEELHDAESRLFHWSIGAAALKHMGAATPKA